MNTRNIIPCYDLYLHDLDKEYWVDIINYEGHYKVSNYGRIKSIGRYVNSSNGSRRWVKEKILKQHFQDNRELNVKLSSNAIAKTHTISVVMANAFLRDRKDNEVVCQLSKNNEDCTLQNLKIMTHSESVKLGYKNGKLKDWGIGDASAKRRKEYEKTNGKVKDGVVTHLTCSKCFKEQPISDFYKRENITRRECKNCLIKKQGVKELGKFRKSKLLAINGRRRCSICKIEKSLDEDFGNSRSSFLGKSNSCKACVKVFNKRYRDRNKKTNS